MNMKTAILPLSLILLAVIGPCIRPESYTVGAEFKEYFPQDVSEAAHGFSFDIASANTRQMTAAGTPERLSTITQPRPTATSGRLAGRSSRFCDS